MIDIKMLSEEILNVSQSSVVKYKILTELLDYNENSKEVINLRKQLNESKWVKGIVSEQRYNGSWGRFHSQDSKEKQKYKTTESAVKYLSHLGLKRGDEPIDRACDYMEALLNNAEAWPDAWEGNRWFATGVDLFITSKLALFGCDDQRYNSISEKWIAILSRAFSDGVYNPSKADDIAKEVVGVDIHDSYIGLSSVNSIIFFANSKHKMSEELQRQYLHWLHTYPKNIFYLVTHLTKHPMYINKPCELSDWIVLMNYLSKFDGFYEEFDDELNWLVSVCDSDGLWDLGKALAKEKLSDNWRLSTNRKIDQTIYVLSIFKN